LEGTCDPVMERREFCFLPSTEFYFINKKLTCPTLSLSSIQYSFVKA
jgi:hypothetical protein